MRKEKLKNDSFWRAGTLPFVVLWAGSYTAAWLGVLYLIEWLDDVANLSMQETNNVAIAFILLFAGLIHVQIVERLLKQSMRGWMLFTLVGTLITFFTFRDSSMNGSSQTAILITSLSLLVPVSLVQTVWLWRRVKAAWLWPLASLVAAIVFVMPMRGGSAADDVFIVATLLYGLIQGGVMRYLWTQARDTEKSKVDAAAADNVDEARVRRLQEQSNKAALLASISDERGSQQRGRF